MNTFPFTQQQLLHFGLLSCMQEAVFGPFFLASKLNVAGSIPVTRFQQVINRIDSGVATICVQASARALLSRPIIVLASPNSIMVLSM